MPLGAEQCEKAYEHNVTQRYAAQERENCFKKQRRANDWKRLNATHDTAGGAVKRIKLQFDDRPADPASSSSGSPSDATAGSDAASVGNVVAGGVPRDAAQDTVVSGGADGPREGHDGKEPAKRQRTEKTELEMEASNVAKIKDSRRILEQRRDGWALENINHRDAAMRTATQGNRHALHQADSIQHGIYAEHKERNGWDTCANSSATSQMIP